jgi:hypothetical protein
MNGALFQPLALAIFLAVLVGTLAWLVVFIRKGYASTSRRAGVVIACLAWGAVVVGPLLAAAWMLLHSTPLLRVADAMNWTLGDEWYQGKLYLWLLVVYVVSAAVFAASWLLTTLLRGPVQGTVVVGQSVGDAVLDLLRLSPRRVWALARLAIQESIRRRVVVVFVVFIVLLLFAGWYLDPGSDDPARLYIDFVLTATSYLVWLLALFLSSQSLPADIKNHTIYTVVTKPVRPSEVVLGRIVGFAAVTTFLLLVMGLISYVFVGRGLAHTHQLLSSDLEAVKGAAGKPAGFQGLTTLVHGHRHTAKINSSGKGIIEIEQRHWHSLESRKNDGETAYELGPEEGLLVARVPVYGKLRFTDRATGLPTEKGINVGDECAYRSFISGGSLAAAIWTFEGVTKEQFPKGLPVEMTIEVFRTYKGNIEQRVPGSLMVRNPKTHLTSARRRFESKEFKTDVHLIPLKLQGENGKQLDLFKDLVADGKVEIWLRCEAPAQNFGMARADMYLRAGDAPFAWNFVKGYFGIWLQSLLLIALGVTFSTFLSGPVALIATLGALLGGLANDFMFRLATQQTYGGGPFESLRRLVTQEGVTAQLEPGLPATVVKTLDQPAELGLRGLSMILPDFGKFSFSEYVASGFNIPGDTVLIYTLQMFAFVLPVFVAGYLCLKNREVAR